MAAYLLQLIGVICFILAAIKSFEPLIGVGFTLVLIGYDKKSRNMSLTGMLHGATHYEEGRADRMIDLFKESDKHSGSNESKSTSKKKKKRREVKVEEVESETDGA